MKKIIALTVWVFILVALLTGCDNSDKTKEDYEYIDISTVEELYAMETEQCYTLQNDIDLKGREWYPLSVKGFNGNGFTVSNFVIKDNSDCKDIAFFLDCSWLENVTFDNAKVAVANKYRFVSVAVAQIYSKNNYSETLAENITVKNSSITAPKAEYSSFVCGIAPSNIKNCKVMDSKIVAGYLGVICATGGVEIENCSVNNIECKGRGGGICASADRNCKITKCRVTNSTFDGSFGGLLSTALEGSTISACEVNGNTFNIENANAAGLIIYFNGNSVSNCLSANNNFISSKSGEIFVSCVIGQNSGTIVSTLGYNNTISRTSSNTKIAGFICKIGAVVKDCGSAPSNFTLNESGVKNLYDYTPDSSSLINFHYLEESELYNPEFLITNLNLNRALWSLSAGSLPKINFSEV